MATVTKPDATHERLLQSCREFLGAAAHWSMLRAAWPPPVARHMASMERHVNADDNNEYAIAAFDAATEALASFANVAAALDAKTDRDFAGNMAVLLYLIRRASDNSEGAVRALAERFGAATQRLRALVN
jgi:hypothetical protein